MTSTAATVDQYLAELPEDRRQAISAVRQVILANLNPGFEEGMQYGMIGYYIPHSIYPKGYHCDPKQPLPFVGLASQKNHMALYLNSIYMDEESRGQFIKDYMASGKKLDMGAGCVQFRSLENLPLEVVGNAVKSATVEGTIEMYDRIVALSSEKRS
jgi:hypothetical protein